jgi:hypothetical protein
MLTIPNLKDIQSVNDELFTFVWNFKHGDNIVFNFEVLKALYESRSIISDKNKLNKPITIFIVSIIEAILIDFLTRIDQATKHLPANVSGETLDLIKEEIEKKKKPEKIEDGFGERIFLRRKMYHFNEIIKILKKYELLAERNDEIYEQLMTFGDIRNRVHIENYHQKLEDRENEVFTSQRLTALEELLANLWNKMKEDYKRPWQPASEI